MRGRRTTKRRAAGGATAATPRRRRRRLRRAPYRAPRAARRRERCGSARLARRVPAGLLVLPRLLRGEPGKNPGRGERPRGRRRARGAPSEQLTPPRRKRRATRGGLLVPRPQLAAPVLGRRLAAGTAGGGPPRRRRRRMGMRSPCGREAAEAGRGPPPPSQGSRRPTEAHHSSGARLRTPRRRKRGPRCGILPTAEAEEVRLQQLLRRPEGPVGSEPRRRRRRRTRRRWLRWSACGPNGSSRACRGERVDLRRRPPDEEHNPTGNTTGRSRADRRLCS